MEESQVGTQEVTESHRDDDDFLPDMGYEYLHDHLTDENINQRDHDYVNVEKWSEENHNNKENSSMVQDENLNVYGDYIDDEDADSLAGVNEADEAVNLSDILAARDSALSEEELWALCRECCLVLEVVNGTPDMFQTLCITPDTVAFDNTGNVCFLDLGSDPEPLYLPPEFGNVSNNYKSHLYSLGMTLLYAAEYNVESSQSDISTELRGLFGCMTLEILSSRPCLEDIITLCEEELVGKSSQEVCIDIAQTFALPTPPPPDLTSVSLADVTASLANYLESQSNLISTPGAEVSGIQENNEEFSSGAQEHHIRGDSSPHVTEDNSDMPMRGIHTGIPVPTGNCGVRPTPAARKRTSVSENTKGGQLSKPPLPKKPDLNKSDKVTDSGSNSNVMDTNQSDNQKIELGERLHKDESVSNLKDSSETALNARGEPEYSAQVDDTQTKWPRKQKGITLRDVLDVIDRPFTEEELWSLCREGIVALNRKRKHLPAYISPDTISLRESGALSFKAIPDEKPLEVIYMAPEIQQKGQLSDKMCLFGLGVTLQGAAGKDVLEDPQGTSSNLRELIKGMITTDPDKRSSIEDVSELCGEQEQERGVSSSSICQALYQEAFEKLADNMAFAMPKGPSQILDPPSSSPPALNGSAFRSVQGSLIKPSVKPISNLPEVKGHQALPSQYMSSATHFKPIVLHQSMTPAAEVTEASKKSDSSQENQPNDKDKEVVKKLKQLKQNLMKHRQPGKDDADAKVLPTKSTKSPHSSPKDTNESSKKTVAEDRETHNKSSSDTKSESGGTLESLLSEIQKQGAVPDTQSLASAIAQFLQDQMAQTPNQNTAQGQTQGQGQTQSQQGQFVTQGQTQVSSPPNIPVQINPQIPNMSLPTQVQPHMIGQTISVPLAAQQYGRGFMAGYPLQVQLQQDPHTGFIQLVPTGILPQAVNLQGATVAGTLSRSNSNCDNQSVNSSKSPKPQNRYSDNSSADNSAILNSSFNSNRSRAGRTARDLIQKTANVRSNQQLQRVSSPIAGHTPQKGEPLWRSKSAHALDHADQSTPERTFSLAPEHVYDDSFLTVNKRSPGRVINDHTLPHHRLTGGYPQSVLGRHSFTQPPRTRSQSSSPSPSKDSGVSGMNSGYKPPPPGSLMERLLSNVNETQQQKLGKVVHLLREEFAFDGYMENGVEDIAMAEYIASLGNLKKETFVSAITEKYSDLYWGSDLLYNLYDAANGVRSNRHQRPVKNNAKTPEESPHSKQQNVLPSLPMPGLDDQDARLSSSPDFESVHGRLKPSCKRAADAAFQPNSLSRQPERHQHRPVQPHHHNTSDSSDTEQYDRRRRYRRKQHTDKSRSNSGLNIQTAGYDTPSMETHPLGKGNTISPRLQMHITNGESPLIQNGSVPEPVIHDWKTEIPKASHSNNPNSLVQDDDKSIKVERPPPSQNNIRQNTWVATPDTQKENNSLDRRKRPMSDGPVSGPTRQSTSHLPLVTLGDNTKLRVKPEKPPRHTGVHLNRTEGHVQPGPKPMKAIHRESSTSSHSSGMAEVPFTKLSRNMSQLSLTDDTPSDSVYRRRRGHVVFHSAMMELFNSPEIEKFTQEIDEDNPDWLNGKLASIKQQLMMERRMKRKSQTFYGRLNETPKAAKGEQKSTIAQVSRDIDEMTQRIRHLELCRTHIEMLQAELSGIHTSYLHSIATCHKGQPLHLKPCQENPLLTIQNSKGHLSGCDIVQSGTPEGLMSYLFANTALRDGFTHQFMFCFRYFVGPVKLLSFLINTWKSAAESSKSQSQNANLPRIQQRVMDLIFYWVEGYYSIDFQRKHEAIELLHAFLQLSDIAVLDEGQELKQLLSNSEEGHGLDLLSARADEDIHIYKSNTPTKWGSLKNILGRGKSSSPKLTLFHERKTPVTKLSSDDGFLPTKSSRRVDRFTLLDYTPQTLAEQLTLIAQSIFQLTHPVHYLNSKAQGISVAMTLPGAKTPVMQRLSGIDQDQAPPPSLFMDKTMHETAVQLMIEHDQEVAHWVAAEIVNCSNAKNQLSVLSKFLYTAQICKEMRNYGTCLAILDGLENLIVKQLPSWRNLQGKCVSIMEELDNIRLFLKNDGMAITSSPNSHTVPTIPSVLLFLFHVQQQEIGNFQLANGMFKWSKIRSITKIIDQIRVFKDHVYGFEPDFDLQEDLQLRIREFGSQDIHQIAAQHLTNFQKMPSKGISGALRKMKGKLQSK